MTFSVVGISHWKSEVSIRELFYLNNERRHILDQKTSMIEGGVLTVDTCNRTELYAFCDPELLINALSTSTNTSSEYVKEHAYIYSGEKALTHLFQVGVGLDSQVLGDVQIIQQIKKAYKNASDNHLSGEFHQLIQAIFKAHKRTRTETDFGRGTASVGFAATQTALDHFHDLSNIQILLVGAGKMGKVSCKNLVSNGAEHISVINRSINRAKDLAASFDIKAFAYSELQNQIDKADLVITATGAHKPILLPEHFVNCEKPRLVLDLSVPRNVDLAVADLECVTLVDMDSINKVNEEALNQRKQAIPLINAIIQEELAEYKKAIKRSEHILPRLKEIDERISQITLAELDRVKNKLDEEAFVKLEEVTNRIKKKVLAIHINNMDKELEKQRV